MSIRRAPPVARLSTAIAGVLAITACATSRPEPGGTPPDAPAVPASAAAPSQSTLSEAERAEAIASACGDHARKRALTLGETTALEAPRAQRARVARLYAERCGLTESIELTSRLIEFPTVSAREPASTGRAFRDMARFLESFAKDSGLELRVFGENDAWELSLGTGEPTTAFVMHGDVVPIDDGVDKPSPSNERRGATIDPVTGEPLPPGWSRAPFRGTVADGRLYGRGSEDDKGAIAAVLLAMRTLAKLGVEPHGRILAIIGTGEENDWSGMKRYIDASPKLPKHVISVDASFPVVVAESGFVAWQLSAPMGSKAQKKPCAEAIDANAGQFLTQVPGEASLTLSPGRGESASRLLARVRRAAEMMEKKTSGKLRATAQLSGPRVVVRTYGEAVHSSVADEGHNALWALASIAGRTEICANGIGKILRVVDEYMADDHFGEKLGLAYRHETMGKLLVAPTMLRVDAESAKLSVNMRRPSGMEKPEFEQRLDAALRTLKARIAPEIQEATERYVGEPAVAQTEGLLVPTLLEIYRRESGDEHARPVSIRGGTYARLFPGAVSFGPSLPGHPYRGHAPDEYVELDALALLGRSVLTAMLELDAQETPKGSSEPASVVR